MAQTTASRRSATERRSRRPAHLALQTTVVLDRDPCPVVDFTGKVDMAAGWRTATSYLLNRRVTGEMYVTLTATSCGAGTSALGGPSASNVARTIRREYRERHLPEPREFDRVYDEHHAVLWASA